MYPVANCIIFSCVASSRESSPTSLPSCITSILSHMPRTSGSSLEIISIATPCSRSLFISLKISALAPTSMPRVGSSKMSTLEFVKSHFARTTFCWFPPLRFCVICSIDGVLIWSSSTNFSATLFSSGMFRNNHFVMALRFARVVFSRIVMLSTSPWFFLSSVSKPIPWLMASCGERILTSLPST